MFRRHTPSFQEAKNQALRSANIAAAEADEKLARAHASVAAEKAILAETAHRASQALVLAAEEGEAAVRFVLERYESALREAQASQLAAERVLGGQGK